jgi:DNA-binding MurR/RpiR family transcriptional regulator
MRYSSLVSRHFCQMPPKSAIPRFAQGDREVSRRLDFLPEQRRRAIQPVFDTPRDYVLLSLRQLARKLALDPSTLLRNIRSLGFRQFADFRAYLHERAVALATSIEALDQHRQHSGLPGLIQSSIDCDLKNLRELRNSLDPQRLLSLATRIWSARRTIILAGDMTNSLGTYLEYTLAMLGFDAVTASTPGEMVHRTRAATKRDVVIAVTYGRGLIHTVDALRQASRKGAYCAGISDSFLSPIVGLCSDFFVTPTDRVSFANSYASGMAFINALLVAIANLKRQSVYSRLKEITEEQKTGARFYSGEGDAARNRGPS